MGKNTDKNFNGEMEDQYLLNNGPCKMKWATNRQTNRIEEIWLSVTMVNLKLDCTNLH